VVITYELILPNLAIKKYERKKVKHLLFIYFYFFYFYFFLILATYFEACIGMPNGEIILYYVLSVLKVWNSLFVMGQLKRPMVKKML
jgi:hypothetical protein